MGRATDSGYAQSPVIRRLWPALPGKPGVTRGPIYPHVACGPTSVLDCVAFLFFFLHSTLHSTFCLSSFCSPSFVLPLFSCAIGLGYLQVGYLRWFSSGGLPSFNPPSGSRVTRASREIVFKKSSLFLYCKTFQHIST